MKLYHYVAKGNNVLQQGLLSFSQNPQADLSYYFKRSGETTHAAITQWMENCFSGRSRGIRCFSEPIKWHEKSLSLKNFIENADLFAIDVDSLNKDGLIESVYVSPSVMGRQDLQKRGCDEVLNKISLPEIDFSPVDWSICNDEKGWRFAFIRYYLLIIKGGIIPSRYLSLIKKSEFPEFFQSI